MSHQYQNSTSHFILRHSNADHPHDTSQPRQLKRPDGEPSTKQRASGVDVPSQPASNGAAPPTAKLEPAAAVEHPTKHAEPNAIKRLTKPRVIKLLVEWGHKRPRVAASPPAAAAASESQPSADGATEQYAAADAGQAVVVAQAGEALQGERKL